jgi:hypothetical protein
MTGLNATIPDRFGSMLVLESTANGVGTWWHEQWLRAEAGESDYIPCFYPWFRHFEYRRPTTLCTRLELHPEEKQILDLALAQGVNTEDAYRSIQWYRWAVPNKVADLDALHQEYPSTPEEAFITSGNTLFPEQHLQDCYAPLEGVRGNLIEDPDTHQIKFVRGDRRSPLTVFKAPITRRPPDSARYMISGDPAMTIEGDYACIQVLNRGTHEQVATWRARIDPVGFAEEMMKIGKWYHMGVLVPECEGGGQATMGVLLARSYPNIWKHQWFDKAPGKPSTSYGWYTNYDRKSGAIGLLQRMFSDGSILIHDPTTYHELRGYTTQSGGGYGPTDRSGHDDAVMALAINVAASHFEGPYREGPARVDNVFDLFEGIDEAGYR